MAAPACVGVLVGVVAELVAGGCGVSGDAVFSPGSAQVRDCTFGDNAGEDRGCIGSAVARERAAHLCEDAGGFESRSDSTEVFETVFERGDRKVEFASVVA
jgi:hypothetical protein